MNVEELWNDFRFRTLLRDLVRNRNDDTLGPMRLQAMLDYAGGGRQGSTVPNLPAIVKAGFNAWAGEPVSLSQENRREPQIERATTATEEQARLNGFQLDEPEAIPESLTEAVGYVDAQRKLRRNPNEQLAKAADLIEAAIARGGWDATGVMQVALPKGMAVSGLEAFLRTERRVAFTKLTVSMPPKGMKMDANGALDLKSAGAVSGAAGEKAAGWVVVLVK